jgi:hypothetical protein
MGGAAEITERQLGILVSKAAANMRVSFAPLL